MYKGVNPAEQVRLGDEALIRKKGAFACTNAAPLKMAEQHHFFIATRRSKWRPLGSIKANNAIIPVPGHSWLQQRQNQR